MYVTSLKAALTCFIPGLSQRLSGGHRHLWFSLLSCGILWFISFTVHAAEVYVREERTIGTPDVCIVPAVSGRSVAETAAKMVSKVNQLTQGICGGEDCRNPTSVFSVNQTGLSFQTKSQCTNDIFTHTVSVEPEPKQPCCPQEGNPINPGTGQKLQVETDYTSPTLQFIRTYNSHSLTRVRDRIGRKWRFNYDKKIDLYDDSQFGTPTLEFPIADVSREDGRLIQFKKINGVWVSDPDVTDRLEEIPNGWVYRMDANLTETYDSSGTLISQTDSHGNTTSLVYNLAVADGGDGNAFTLDKVIGPFGQTLSFAYDTSGRIIRMIDPAGQVYTYTYSSNSTTNNLLSVIYPDLTTVATDNPKRLYHYENASFRNALTGITDENAVRFATWSYDAKGRVTSSKHAGNVDLVTFIYNANGTTTVNDSNGGVRTYFFISEFGVEKPVEITGDQCVTCDDQAQNTTYDANGFVSSKTDFNGNVTTYVHDVRGLETSRTEAIGTPEERTITTQWHPTFRLPLTITEPGQVTTFTYDAQGRLLTREVAVP